MDEKFNRDEYRRRSRVSPELVRVVALRHRFRHKGEIILYMGHQKRIYLNGMLSIRIKGPQFSPSRLATVGKPQIAFFSSSFFFLVARNHAAMANEYASARTCVSVLCICFSMRLSLFLFLSPHLSCEKCGKKDCARLGSEKEREGANATRDDGICKSPCTSLFSPLVSTPPTPVQILTPPYPLIHSLLIHKPYASHSLRA